MSALELEPHEQLDEIDRRTNEDGTVEVELLKWAKTDGLDRVDVHYRIPTGEVKTESMQWPEANSPEYKFIRLIDSTPYTLRTAESINDDDTLRVNTNPSSWTLELPKEENLRDRIPEPKKGIAFEFAKFALYPLSLVGMVANLMEKDSEYVGVGDEPYDNTYLDNGIHEAKHISALKSAVWLTLWVLLVALIIL